MTLPLAGPFSAGDVNVELKRLKNQIGTPDDPLVRQLARKPSGMYSAADLRGRSAEVLIELSASDHNFNTSTLHQLMVNAIGGDWGKKGNTFRIRVKPGVQLVSANTTNACFWFGGGVIGNTVIVENHGYILGRGGAGGIIPNPGGQNPGSPGGVAILSDGGVALVIDNAGVIAGGGGGGGATGWYDGGSGNYTSTGGGGAPFGAAGGTNNGSNYRWWGIAASFDSGGGRW
ncbi:hypothetical protein [Chromobacterium haemolyticum]|uniref:hypothetical protein n=1 Tax=Chromobacterium haemolyticum TaxID=394935 RepID=UPI000DEF5F1D|nr:hypothetical protein [Chromobacterium haemolyticum]